MKISFTKCLLTAEKFVSRWRIEITINTLLLFLWHRHLLFALETNTYWLTSTIEKICNLFCVGVNLGLSVPFKFEIEAFKHQCIKITVT